ncbi:MAG TPA: hypothetical protein VNM92_17225 [Thermoanaerobaculia bacterium]|nr:hypothetical protein [Thermoanaerobaculia bacterium]
MNPSKLLELIDANKIPSVILIGGDSEFLAARTFMDARDRIQKAVPGIAIQPFAETADLTTVIDSFRTHSLFGGRRLLLVPEVNAFVTKKEVTALYEKVISDWRSAKTERKRSSSLAKFLHLLGLTGLDVESSDRLIADAFGLDGLSEAVAEILQVARSTGRKATRGETDAALLTEAVVRGGAPGSILLMKTGPIPTDSATLLAIQKDGVVVECNLSRERFGSAFSLAIEEIEVESGARFEERALTALRARLGIDRLLADKFSKEVPDLRLAASEAERLAMLAGRGGQVSVSLVEREISAVSGGARFELASLFAEKRPVEAIAKLRDLVSQSRRDDPKTASDIHYGKFLFTIADEIRQLIGILSWARLKKVDLRKGANYNRFKDALADDLSEFLKRRGLVKQKPHPFALHKRFEAARGHDESVLLELLTQIAEAEFQRKCGGYSAEVGLELAILNVRR